MIRAIIFFTINFLLASVLVYGNSGAISGHITDKQTGEPLPWVTVMVEGTNRGTATTIDGSYDIPRVSPGTHKMMASIIGYATEIIEVVVEPGQHAHVDIVLNEDPLRLSGVVVTATRTPRYIKDVPVRTEVISRKEIRDKGAHNLYEALDGTPGLRVEQQCQACNFSILRMQGLGADHTQILLDGQPVYSGLASVYGLQQLGTADIGQIEVVKGAGSALYGSNAVAGAINIISTVPHKTEYTIGVEFGEHSTNKYEITAGTRKDNVAISLSAQQSRGNAIDETGDGNGRDEVHKPDGISDRVRTNIKNAGFSVFVDDLSGFDQLVIRGHIISETRQGGELLDDAFENPFYAGSERIITDRYSFGFGYSKNFRNGSELHADATFTRHKRNATNDTFLSDYEELIGETPPVEELRPYLADEDLYVASLNYVFPLGGTHRLLAGMQYSRNELDESGKYVDHDLAESYTSFSSKKADQFGAYLQDEFFLSGNLEMVAGIRFDYHKSKDSFRGSGNVATDGVEPIEYNESTVNPRFAMKYKAAENLILRGSFGTGFRVPYGFSEDLHLCSGSPRVYKSADLKPEKSYSYSFTADYFLSAVNLSLNLYRTDLKNAISFAEADEDIVNRGYTYQWENIDDARVMGAEIGSQFIIADNLSLAVNFAYNNSEYDHGRTDWEGTEYYEISKKISRYPETSGGLKIDYALKNWSFVLNGDYKGKMYIDYLEAENENEIKIKETESFVTLNAKASYRFPGGYTVYLGARNLTDYIQEEKHTDDAAFLYAPTYGRIIYGGLQMTL